MITTSATERGSRRDTLGSVLTPKTVATNGNQLRDSELASPQCPHEVAAVVQVEGDLGRPSQVDEPACGHPATSVPLTVAVGVRPERTRQ